MVSFVIDALLILICIIVISVSVKRGFVRTILSIASAIAAVLLSVVFTPIVSEFLYNKFFLKSITNGISSTVASLVTENTSEGIAEMLESMPEALADILKRYKIGEDTVEGLLESAKLGDETVQSISEAIASPIATTISNVLAFAAVFVVAVIALKIVVWLVDVIFKLPGLDSVNKGAGLLLGLVLAVVVIFVYSEAAAQLVGALSAISPDIFPAKAIDDTIIVKFFSENNIFIMVRDAIQNGVTAVN